MSVKIIVCTSDLLSGRVCGETAIVHNVHYLYDRASWPGAETDEFVLRATIYQITCPRCGDREQFEKA
jgi:hypothetical protein